MKNKYGYKILTILTLLLPMMSFVLISTITNKPHDAELYLYEETSVINFETYEGNYIVYSPKASYTGFLVPYNEEYGVLLEENEIIKVNRDYYTPFFNQETQAYELTNLEDIPPTVEKANTWTLSVAIMVAIGIVALIIGSKMDVLKKNPRASVLVSLLVLALIFMGLNSIIYDMYRVFVIATASWGGYCIEYLIHEGNISKLDGEKAESTLLNKLKEALHE